jgi:hypothetical protein
MRWLIVVGVAAIAAIIAVSLTTGSKPVKSGIFELVDDGRGIKIESEPTPFIYSTDLPDTVPTVFAHAESQRFKNSKFHFISVSPNQRFVTFACGEGDQWLGMIDIGEQYVKFLLFGIQTTFYPGIWSPDSKYLTYSFYGPDKRLHVYITDPLGRKDPTPLNLNGWFKTCYQGERFRPIGWRMDTDTVFSFAITNAKGEELEHIDLPLRFDPAQIPAHMKREMEQMKK